MSGKLFLYSRRMAVPGYRNINLNIVINTKYIYIYTYVKKMDKSIFDCFLFLFLDLVTSDIDQD